MSSPVPTEQILRFDSFELDVRAGELRKRGVKQRLQGQPLQVLTALLRRAGDLVTREELRDEIWQSDTFVDFDHSLHNAIARVRETLGDSADHPRYIETLPRRGYRFIGSVEEIGGGAVKNRLKAPEASSSASEIHSLAVLPLQDLSGDPAQEYFAEGMTEALITSLAKVQALRVISRTSAMRYKGVSKSLPQIARELNVDAVIEGSVLRSGERVRITAQLIHAATDRHLWAESYERDFRDILSLQSEIAQQVANEVRIVLTPEERARFGQSRRIDPAAHELYLQGRYHWNKRSEESSRKALTHFQRAIDHDPTYALGYAGIADCYNILGYYNVLAPAEAYPKARAAALKALELDDSLAAPHASLAVAKRDYEWDWPGALEEFQRAIELNPGYVEAYHWRSTLLYILGRREEANLEKKNALAMDPLSIVIRTDLGRMSYFQREYDRAIEHYRAAIEMDSNFSTVHLWMAQPYAQKGWFDEAISELTTGIRLSGENIYALARLGAGYAFAGKDNEARAVLQQMQELSGKKYVSPYDVAMIYVGLNEIDEAFAWMEKAVEERSIWMGYLNLECQLDRLRGDARFKKLVRRVGLPD
jgi:TolB-like protein/Flp pilus assembly protein TadD